MSVYVDAAIHPWRGKMWCHLIADSEEELHAFAIKKLGMRREWYQTDSILLHYDITASKRELAIARGAIELDRTTMAARVREALDKRKNAREAQQVKEPSGEPK